MMLGAATRAGNRRGANISREARNSSGVHQRRPVSRTPITNRWRD